VAAVLLHGTAIFFWRSAAGNSSYIKDPRLKDRPKLPRRQQSQDLGLRATIQPTSLCVELRSILPLPGGAAFAIPRSLADYMVILRTAIDALTAVLFPAPCRICGTTLLNASRIPICDSCLASFQRIE